MDPRLDSWPAESSPPRADLRPGIEPASRVGAGDFPARIAGYDIEGVIGRGASGVVLRARQRSLGRAVALKLFDGIGSAGVDLERFGREARTAAALDHPNVIRVIDSGVDEASGAPFTALELVEGVDLQSAVGSVGPMGEARALQLGIQVCRAIGAAHAAGMVHRDIKPSNILITADGTAKVADFGLAKRLDDRNHLTNVEEIVGTPHYMSPEQARGDPLDIRTDIYALGLVMYFMVTGKVAFPGRYTIETLRRRQEEECPDPRAFDPTLSEGYAALVAWLAAREVERRPREPFAAEEAFARLLGVEPGRRSSAAHRPGRSGAAAPGVAAAATGPRPGGPRRTSARAPHPAPAAGGGRSFAALSLIALAGAITGAVAIGLILSASDEPVARPESQSRPGPVAAVDPAETAPPPDPAPSDRTGPTAAEVARSSDPEDGEPREGGSTFTFADLDPPADAAPPLPAVAPAGTRAPPPSVAPVGPTPRSDHILDPTPYRLWLETKALRLSHVFGHHARHHASMVVRLGASDDGARLVSLDLAGVLSVTDTASGRELARLDSFADGPGGALTAAAIAPSGRHVVVGTQRGLLLSVAVGADAPAEPVYNRVVHEGAVHDVVIAADGRRIVSAGADGTVRLFGYDPETGLIGAQQHELRPLAPVRNLALSRDGDRLGMGYEHVPPEAVRASFWDLTTDPPHQTQEMRMTPGGGAARLVLDPTGDLALVTEDMTLDLQTSRVCAPSRLRFRPGAPPEVAMVNGLGVSGVRATAIAPDGRRALLAAYPSGQTLLIDLDAQRVLQRLPGHQLQWVQAVTFVGADRAATGGADGKVRLWDLTTGAEIHPRPEGHIGRMVAVAAAPRAPRLATLAADGVRIWDAKTRAPVHHLPQPEATRATCLAVDPTAATVAAAGRGWIGVWSAERPPHDPAKAWSWTGTVEGLDAEVSLTAIATDGQRVITGASSGHLVLWYGQPAQPMQLGVHGGAVVSITRLDDGRIVSVSENGEAVFWAAPTDGEPGRRLSNLNVSLGETGVRVRAGEPSGDGRYFAVVTDVGAVVIDVIARTRVGNVNADFRRGRRPEVAWSRAGDRLVVAQNRSLIVFDVGPTGLTLRDKVDLTAPGRYVVTGLAVSDDGGTVYVATRRGSLLAFELR